MKKYRKIIYALIIIIGFILWMGLGGAFTEVGRDYASTKMSLLEFSNVVSFRNKTYLEWFDYNKKPNLLDRVKNVFEKNKYYRLQGEEDNVIFTIRYDENGNRELSLKYWLLEEGSIIDKNYLNTLKEIQDKLYGENIPSLVSVQVVIDNFDNIIKEADETLYSEYIKVEDGYELNYFLNYDKGYFNIVFRDNVE